jgi:hypothetical protein
MNASSHCQVGYVMHTTSNPLASDRYMHPINLLCQRAETTLKLWPGIMACRYSSRGIQIQAHPGWRVGKTFLPVSYCDAAQPRRQRCACTLSRCTTCPAFAGAGPSLRACGTDHEWDMLSLTERPVYARRHGRVCMVMAQEADGLFRKLFSTGT